MATYVALTTQNYQTSGYSVVLIGTDGESKSDVEDKAMRHICGIYWDKPKPIGVDTELKNLVVLPISTVKRKYALALDDYYYQLPDYENM